MRTLSSFEHLVATADGVGLQIHQLAGGTVETSLDGATVRLRVETDYPWDGRVSVDVEETPDRPWALQLRVPAWAHGGSLSVGHERRLLEPGSGMALIERTWRSGDRVALELDMPPRFTLPDRHIDAVRGCAAVERGPIVYCLGQADMPAGVGVDDVEVDLGQTLALAGEVDPALSDTPTVEVMARPRPEPAGSSPRWPYRTAVAGDVDSPGGTTTLRVVPYFAWANRTPGAMRVWLPARGGRERAGRAS